MLLCTPKTPTTNKNIQKHVTATIQNTNAAVISYSHQQLMPAI